LTRCEEGIFADHAILLPPEDQLAAEQQKGLIGPVLDGDPIDLRSVFLLGDNDFLLLEALGERQVSRRVLGSTVGYDREDGQLFELERRQDLGPDFELEGRALRRSRDWKGEN